MSFSILPFLSQSFPKWSVRSIYSYYKIVPAVFFLELLEIKNFIYSMDKESFLILLFFNQRTTYFFPILNTYFFPILNTYFFLYLTLIFFSV